MADVLQEHGLVLVHLLDIRQMPLQILLRFKGQLFALGLQKANPVPKRQRQHDYHPQSAKMRQIRYEHAIGHKPQVAHGEQEDSQQKHRPGQYVEPRDPKPLPPDHPAQPAEQHDGHQRNHRGKVIGPGGLHEPLQHKGAANHHQVMFYQPIIAGKTLRQLQKLAGIQGKGQCNHIGTKPEVFIDLGRFRPQVLQAKAADIDVEKNYPAQKHHEVQMHIVAQRQVEQQVVDQHNHQGAVKQALHQLLKVCELHQPLGTIERRHHVQGTLAAHLEVILLHPGIVGFQAKYKGPMLHGPLVKVPSIPHFQSTIIALPVRRIKSQFIKDRMTLHQKPASVHTGGIHGNT